jgi:hypothetical protein
MFNVVENDDVINAKGICIAMQCCDNEQFDEMMAQELCVLDIYKDAVKIDMLTVNMRDFAKTFEMGLNDAKAYKWLKKRVQQNRALAH